MDVAKWLIMPTKAMEAKLNQFESDMGLPDGFTEKIFQRLYKDNLMAISIIGGFRGMRHAVNENSRGKKFNDEDVNIIMDGLGFAVGKPLKTDAAMINDGWWDIN